MELRKLNMKLMFTYLELIEQLSKDPTQTQSVEERSAEIQRAHKASERSGNAAATVEGPSEESNQSGWLFETRQKLFARLTSTSPPPAFPLL
ncbi:hypothetical protein EV182_000526 [Spiromyces aspiralis]|uniref:Uncharacterized protein n=1 Tax=Spiromyces aspiralis TaxID=68401 RepID=A0ACC1I212_9FUNG|nr:hypothetical protein EV182_000526 [Spiromyces aspiralis]